MSALRGRFRSPVGSGPFGALALALLLTACGGGGGGSTVQGQPQVMVTPAATTLTTAQPLSVAVKVSTGAGFANPSGGVVTLTSGAFNSGPVAVSGGQATIVVPAGVLPVGADSLTVSYGSTASPAVTGSGATNVSVTAASAPGVTAQSTSVLVNGHVFSVLPYGAIVLASISNNGMAGSRSGINVYNASSPTQLTYGCTQPIAHANAEGDDSDLMLSAAPNGPTLALAIDDPGVDFLNGPALANCSSTETLVSQGAVSTKQGTFAAAITPDGRYAFVANEYGVVANDSTGAPILGNVGVVALQYNAAGALTGGTLVGQFSTGGQAIANVTISPDGQRLYVTSEIAHPGVVVSASANPVLAHGGCIQGGNDDSDSPSGGSSTGQPNGLLSVVDVQKAEASPTASAIIATVAAGCSPVRVVETSDQQVIWVAARGDNNVLAFSAHALETTPDTALLGYANTGGIAPVGLQLFHDQQLLAVANSNRFSSPLAVGNMVIMNAVPVAPAVLQTVAASYFPRSVTVAADDSTLYLSDYYGGRFQIVSTSTQ